MADTGNQQSRFFDLTEISKWTSGMSEIELPSLQRVFVWRAHQIEELWDSLLRGYPIGAFLLAEGDRNKFFLLDGQQRATSIAIGHYDPWLKQERETARPNSLQNIDAVVWIDLTPTTFTTTQKFVIRVVTQSHPWGYQRQNHNTVLSISDRKRALQIFHAICGDDQMSYVELPLKKVFPYDSDLPVPLSFLLKAVSEGGYEWRGHLLKLCREHLPENLQTKYSVTSPESYFERLSKILSTVDLSGIETAVKNLYQVRVPAIVVGKEILETEDPELENAQDPTLFIRLNASGTRIAGEELIYSIYKATFPEAKQLVENIAADFISPALVISLISRLLISEINEGRYPGAITVNDFRRWLKDNRFKDGLKREIGGKNENNAATLFKMAIAILRSREVNVPNALVKATIKNSPELFLMLLQWIRVNADAADVDSKKNRIIGTLTSLSWFGRDNAKYVRDLWEKIALSKNFWSNENLCVPFFERSNFLMYPLIPPEILRSFLIENVVNKENSSWSSLTPERGDEVETRYRSILNNGPQDTIELESAIGEMWDSFITKLIYCRPLVLFAQREYINARFPEYNRIEALDDTNTPWDWDHIYPDSWIRGKWYINPKMKHWNNSIGNLRALSLEENRSESNSLSPSDRLSNAINQSFVSNKNYDEFWSKISKPIDSKESGMVKVHLSAIIHRLCDLYQNWYEALNIEELFGQIPNRIL